MIIAAAAAAVVLITILKTNQQLQQQQYITFAPDNGIKKNNSRDHRKFSDKDRQRDKGK